MLVRGITYILIIALVGSAQESLRTVASNGFESHDQQMKPQVQRAQGAEQKPIAIPGVATKPVVRALRPGEDQPSYLGSTFSEDTHSFSSAVRYGSIYLMPGFKGVLFNGQLAVTNREIKGLSLVVVSPDSRDSQIYSANGQYIVDDGYFICRLTASVDVLYGALGGVAFLGVGGEKEWVDGLNYRTSNQQCFGKIELGTDEQGHRIGVPLSEVKNYCERCTGGIEGKSMKEMLAQTHQRAKNDTTFTIKDQTCDKDDDCYTNDIRFHGRCMMKSEPRKIDGKDKIYYYRRCEERIRKGGYCTNEMGGFMSWFGPRKCDAGLTCTFIDKKYDWNHFKWDETYKCLTTPAK